MEKPESGSRRIDRRQFVANVFLAVAGTLGVTTLAERFLAFLYPVVPPERDVELPVVSRSSIPAGGGIVVHTPAGHIALEDTNGELRAFSAVCTHLGCIIEWQPGEHHVWFCECHKGKYDRAGRVTGGPPPRPLDPLQVAVRDDQVYVKLKVRVPRTAPDQT